MFAPQTALVPPVRWFAVAPASSSGGAGNDNDSAASQGFPPGIKLLLDKYHTIPQERTRNFAIVAHVDHGKSISASNIAHYFILLLALVMLSFSLFFR
jgi:hypothetical protein